MFAILADFLKNSSGDNLILFKNQDEREYISKWLKLVKSKDMAIADGDIDSMIDKCTKCRDILSRKKAFGTGSNGLMIILNAPRMLSRLDIKLYKKESASLLKKMLEAIELNMRDCYITNLIKCESSDIMQKPSEMVGNCMSILEKELEKISPRAVLVMGEILSLQDLIHKTEGITWYNTEHAISLIKNPVLKKPAWETLKLIKQKLIETDDKI